MNLIKLISPTKKLLQFLSYLLWVALVISFFVRSILPLTIWSAVGRQMGTLAALSLAVSLIPGVIKRFSWQGFWRSAQIFLMAQRRWIGILMFQFVLLHFIWNRLFFYLKFGIPNLNAIPLSQQIGFAAFLLLFPLVLTSNDLAVKILRRNWQRIHYLIYIIVWLVMLHTALIGELKYTLLMFFLALAQVVSWIWKWRGVSWSLQR